MTIQMTLTDFANVSARNGATKVTRIARIKRRGDYNPAFDFYKPLRDGLVAIHQLRCARGTLAVLSQWARNTKQERQFPQVIDGYHRWWGRKDLHWFEPPRAVYEDQGVRVVINPELGLMCQGVPHVIKLHFLAKPLTRDQVVMMNHLLAWAAEEAGCDGAVVGVLDMRRGKLLSPSGQRQAATALLGELASIAAVWEAA